MRYIGRYKLEEHYYNLDERPKEHYYYHNSIMQIIEYCVIPPQIIVSTYPRPSIPRKFLLDGTTNMAQRPLYLGGPGGIC